MPSIRRRQHALVTTVLEPQIVSSGEGLSAYTTKALAFTNYAYWPFDETSGATAVDGENDYDGAIGGTTVNGLTGADGQPAYSFDGSGDYVDMSAASGFLAGLDMDEFTFSIRFKVDSYINYRRVWQCWLDANNYLQVLVQATSLFLYAEFDGVAYARTVSTSSTDWQHAAVTCSQANTRLRWFLNGSQVGTDFTLTTSFNGTPTDFLFGIDTGLSLYPFDGGMQHALWSNHEGTPADIVALESVA